MPEAVFTGERPGWGDDFDYDEARHLAAYHYACELAPGLDVLDAGCGEGFGTHHLADHAASVLGLDYSAEAIAACRKTWDKPNLRFEQADLTGNSVPEGQYDLVLNFQVLEHIQDDAAFVARLRDFVKPGGRLLLTTPNRLMSFSENPYHIREYTAPELTALLKQVFPNVRVTGMHGNAKVRAFDDEREKAVQRILKLDPLGLRDLIPRSVVEFAFAKLALLVRRQARDAAGGDRMVPEDFFVSDENPDEALDLVALCEI